MTQSTPQTAIPASVGWSRPKPVGNAVQRTRCQINTSPEGRKSMFLDNKDDVASLQKVWHEAIHSQNDTFLWSRDTPDNCMEFKTGEGRRWLQVSLSIHKIGLCGCSDQRSDFDNVTQIDSWRVLS